MLGRRLLSFMLQSRSSIERDVKRLRISCGSSRFSRLLLYSTGDAGGMDEYEYLCQGNINDTEDDITNESEMLYFLGQAQKDPQKIPLRDPEKYSNNKSPPVKQRLAYTNKRLFGPLLETTGERRRRLKMEKGSSAGKLSTSTNTGRKSQLPVDPLIYRSENAHMVGIFQTDKTRNLLRLTKHKPTVVLKFLQSDRDDKDIAGNSRTGTTIIKKPVIQYCSAVKENLVIDNKPVKLVIASWNENKEKQSASSDDDYHASSLKQESPPSIKSDTDNMFDDNDVNDDDRQLDAQSLNMSVPVNDFPSQVQSEASCIVIDNSNFEAVPKSINISMIKSFPLFRDNLSASCTFTQDTQAADRERHISTIGIFDGGYQQLPSVRKILDATMPAANRITLEKWKARMIKKLGEEGFEQYRKELMDRGNLLHGCIQSELSGVTPSVEEMPTIQGMWTSLRTVLPNVSNVRVLESRLIHPYLHYQGALDCVGLYRGTPMLIEWKTSSKPKLSVKSMFDDPLQVAAYLGALNFDENYHLPFQAECAMLVVAYDSGLPATVHTLTRDHCEHYWREWRARLMQFWRQHEESATDSQTDGTW